jgi:hypothetical protein
MKEEVDVSVDEPRHESTVAQVNQLSPLGMRHRRPGFRNSLAAYQNFAGTDYSSRLNIEETRGMQHHDARFVWRLGVTGGYREQPNHHGRQD